MAAYIIVDIDVTDAVRYEEYKKLAVPTVEVCGGKYIARGGKSEVLEGEWSPTRLVILQFDTVEQAKNWYDSVEYRDVRSLRHETTTSKMVLIEGL